MDPDVVIVPAGPYAWPMYFRYGAYVCQPHRSFRAVDYLGFYADGEIKPIVPLIRGRLDGIEIGDATAAALARSSAPTDQEIARIVRSMINDNYWVGLKAQVFVLSGRDDERTLKLPAPVRNTKTSSSGKTTAWVQMQRYVRSATLLRGPRTTSELDAWEDG
jgi:hypothetical protein